jgi:hypothetical protein
VAFDYRYPTPLPSTKGWGPGYPNCQDIARQGESIFWPGVHADIAELVSLLVADMRRRGFVFQIPGCWGFGCRGTKSSSGSQSVTPSFHSWGLGVDINAPQNPFGNDRTNTQLGRPEFSWVDVLWRSYGFYWLGPPIKDWMPWSFVGSRIDAAAMTVRARNALGGGDDVGALDDYLDGGRMKRKGEPLPANANRYVREGYNEATRIIEAAKTPAPTDVLPPAAEIKGIVTFHPPEG